MKVCGYVRNDDFSGKEACKSQRVFQMPRIGVADDKIAQYAGLHYYTDKELQVQSESACRLACEIENEFLCRSFLYRGAPQGSAYNCQLFHLDHWTLPEGPSAYLNAERPLIDNGERVGTYFENYCESRTLRLSQTYIPSPQVLGARCSVQSKTLFISVRRGYGPGRRSAASCLRDHGRPYHK